MIEHKASILIVEDEKSIRDVLSLNLQMDGYSTRLIDNGADAIDFIGEENVDLVLMDVMLPKVNGLEATKRIKYMRPDLPIIVLSALGQSIDRVKGLKAGADDYVNKPFNYEELLLRIEKQLQKTLDPSQYKSIIKIGKNTINTIDHIISNNNGSQPLSSKEMNLIKYMYANRNRVISREELFANVWGYDSFPNSRTVDNYISILRKYLMDGSGQDYIQSERGIGYKLIVSQE